MAITNGYATLAQLRSELGNYAVADTADDSKLEMSIEAGSRQIDGWCGVPDAYFLPTTSTQDREFYIDEVGYIDLMEHAAPISTLTGLVVKVDYDGDGVYETTLTVDTDFLVLPRNAADLSPVQPFTALRTITSSSNYFPRSIYGRPSLQITAKWGWPATPTPVTKACLIVAIDLFKSKDAAFGIAGGNEFGVLRVTSGIPRLAQGLLASYRRPAVA